MCAASYYMGVTGGDALSTSRTPPEERQGNRVKKLDSSSLKESLTRWNFKSARTARQHGWEQQPAIRKRIVIACALLGVSLLMWMHMCKVSLINAVTNQNHCNVSFLLCFHVYAK
jgi:hypothetical protein